MPKSNNKLSAAADAAPRESEAPPAPLPKAPPAALRGLLEPPPGLEEDPQPTGPNGRVRGVPRGGPPLAGDPSGPGLEGPPGCAGADQPWGPDDVWVEQDGAGYWRCIPCGKMLDSHHVQTDSHRKKLEDFLQARRPLEDRYPDPPEEFLVWMPLDDRNPTGEHWLRCLLCRKWVCDDTSHHATTADGTATGSREHRKNVELHYLPRSGWYRETVVPMKQRCRTVLGHEARPPSAASKKERRSGDGASGLEDPPPTVPPWHIAWSDRHAAFYYWHEETQAVQWERPATEAPLPPWPSERMLQPPFGGAQALGAGGE